MEKVIDLKKTTNILINLKKATTRLKDTKSVLDSLEIPFERFDAIKHEQGLVGCGLSHLKLLDTINPHTVILEDDIDCMPNPITELNIPEEADAIYLGVSNHGYIRNQPYGYGGVVMVTQYAPQWKRVMNMCSTHAILYLSDRYIKAARNITLKYLKSGLPFDLGLASIHKDFNILTPNDPMFYQTEQPELTKFSLQV
mgnify:FL=1|tara:strand:- start:260 stop:853 length:594 start_codon:yes stop_codon:yes gene_type:complete